MSTQIKLGDRVFSALNVEKHGDWEVIHNRNQVYTGALSENGLDKAQFEYDPSKKWFRFGRLIERDLSDTDQGTESYYNIYLKPYIVSEQGIVIEQGQTGATVNGETSTTTLTLNAGNGINIDFSTLGASNPIISIDTSLVATKDDLAVLEDKINSSGGGGTSGSDTTVNLNNPDYAALMELLQVMEVTYDDEPIGVIHNLAGDDDGYVDNGRLNVTTGARFTWVDENTSINCLRFRNTNTGGNRFDGEVYLKVVECEQLDLSGTANFAPVGASILTVSSNAINQKENNILNEWYEWYFPKPIEFKNNKIYAIIPHTDKSYTTVTTTSAKVIFFGTTDVDTAKINTGFWTGNRTENVNVEQTPIFQFCSKTPTTIKMKQ